MTKITNKATRVASAIVLNAAQLAIRANASAVADLDCDEKLGNTIVHFGMIFNGLSVDDFKCARTCWVDGYVMALGCEAASAGTRFAEMVRSAGVVKPQTEKAAKLQAARVAAKSAIDKASETAGDVKAGLASAATASIKLELSSIEAHIIALIRAAKFTQAAQAVAALAESAALV